MRKPDFCKCENKDVDQRLCFRYTDSTPEDLFSHYEAHIRVRKYKYRLITVASVRNGTEM